MAALSPDERNRLGHIRRCLVQPRSELKRRGLWFGYTAESAELAIKQGELRRYDGKPGSRRGTLAKKKQLISKKARRRNRGH